MEEDEVSRPTVFRLVQESWSKPRLYCRYHLREISGWLERTGNRWTDGDLSVIRQRIETVLTMEWTEIVTEDPGSLLPKSMWSEAEKERYHRSFLRHLGYREYLYLMEYCDRMGHRSVIESFRESLWQRHMDGQLENGPLDFSSEILPIDRDLVGFDPYPVYGRAAPESSYSEDSSSTGDSSGSDRPPRGVRAILPPGDLSVPAGVQPRALNEELCADSIGLLSDPEVVDQPPGEDEGIPLPP